MIECFSFAWNFRAVSLPYHLWQYLHSITFIILRSSAQSPQISSFVFLSDFCHHWSWFPPPYIRDSVLSSLNEWPARSNFQELRWSEILEHQGDGLREDRLQFLNMLCQTFESGATIIPSASLVTLPVVSQQYDFHSSLQSMRDSSIICCLFKFHD